MFTKILSLSWVWSFQDKDRVTLRVTCVDPVACFTSPFLISVTSLIIDSLLIDGWWFELKQIASKKLEWDSNYINWNSTALLSEGIKKHTHTHSWQHNYNYFSDTVSGKGPRLRRSEIALYVQRGTGGHAGHGPDLLSGCGVSQPQATASSLYRSLSPSERHKVHFLCHLDTRPGQSQATGWLAVQLWFHCYYGGGWHTQRPCPLDHWGS